MPKVTGRNTVFLSFVASLLALSGCFEVGSNTSTPISMPVSTPTPVFASQPSSNGSMNRANTQRTGVYDTEPLRQLGTVQWKFKAKNDRAVSMPTIADGTIYFGGSDSDHTIYALDAETGNEVWRYQTSFFGSNYSPIVADEIVYISSSDENLYALDSKTGSEIWRFTIQDPSLPWAVFDYPLVVGGVVYVGCTRDAFYALDSKTGAVKWRFPASSWVDQGAAFADDTLYFGSRSLDGRDKTYVYAVDSQTGQERWKVQVELDGVTGTPAVADGVVFVPTWKEGLYALDATTGQMKWQYGAGWAILHSPAVAYNTVYVSKDGNLIALDSGSGQERWVFKTGSTSTVTSPIIAGDIVYFLSTDVGFFIPFVTQPEAGGFLYAVNAHTGKELWKHEVKGLLMDSPIISNGVLYYGDEDGYLYAIR